MYGTFKQTALVLGLLGASVSYASAQGGPVDGKGQAGGTAHRGVAEPSGGNPSERAGGRSSKQDGAMQDGAMMQDGSAVSTEQGAMQGSAEMESGGSAQPGGASAETLRGHSSNDGSSETTGSVQTLRGHSETPGASPR